MNVWGIKMKLCIADINKISLDDICLISPERQAKAMRFRKPDDRKRCIAAGLLIKRYLGNAVITTGKFGKPIADNGVFFNLSHSGRYVLLAVGDREIGCDIERTKIVDSQKLGKIVFCQNEMQKLGSAADKTGLFFEYWTKKESLLKCTGEGFHRNAKSVDVSKDIFDDEGKRYFFKVFKFSDYTVSLCCEQNDFCNTIEFYS